MPRHMRTTPERSDRLPFPERMRSQLVLQRTDHRLRHGVGAHRSPETDLGVQF